MTMKKKTMACCNAPLSSSALFLLLLLNAHFQTSDAVNCARKEERPEITGWKEKECEICAKYECPNQFYTMGCLSDFYDDCSVETQAIEFIKSKTPEQLSYHDGSVLYVSGCYNNTYSCLYNKEKLLLSEKEKRHPTINNPLWYYEKPDDFDCMRELIINDVMVMGSHGDHVNTAKCPFCTFYACAEKKGYGCASDFYDDCSDFTKAIQFVERKTPEQLNYFDGKAVYISGCEDRELNGSFTCLTEKIKVLQAERDKTNATINNPVWYYKTPGDASKDDGLVDCTRLLMVNELKVIRADTKCPFCTAYACAKTGTVKGGMGCASDFYDDCSDFTKAIEFVKNKTSEQLNYWDGEAIYVSGCENKESVEARVDCLTDKSKVLLAETGNTNSSEEYPIWYYKTPGDAPQDSKRDHAGPAENANEDDSVASLDSNNNDNSQEAVFKVSGIMMAFLGFIFAQI